MRAHLARYLIVLLILVLLVAGLMMDPSSAKSAATNGGAIWNSPQSLSTTAFIPVLKSDSTGRLILAYNQDNGLGVENPYYRESVNGGKSWMEAKSIYQSPDNSQQVTFIFDMDDKAHAVWRTQTEIWHSSEDQWPSTAKTITSTAQLVFSPDIAVAPNNDLHVVWSQQDNRIYHAYSEDSGLTWISSTPLTNDSDKSDEPAVAVDQDGNVHVVWEERILDGASYRYEIRHLIGTHNGAGIDWAPSASILSPGIAEARRPAIAAQGDIIHVSFARRVSDTEQYAYYVRHTDESGWSAPVDITGDNPVAMNSNIPFLLVPALVLCDSAPSVYYHGSLVSNGKELILGVNEVDDRLLPDQVDTGEVRAIRPSLACANGTLHMAYERIIAPDKNHQVYYLSKGGHAAFLPLVVTDK